MRGDGLLRHLGRLSPDPRVGLVATAPGAPVLLETGAQGVHHKVRHLLALGTGRRQAMLMALSAKSYWHLRGRWPPRVG